MCDFCSYLCSYVEFNISLLVIAKKQLIALHSTTQSKPLGALSRLNQSDIFWSLTGCYRPLPCLKWASSCSPHFVTLATDRRGACLAVLGEVSILINSARNRISEVNTVKTLCSPRVSRRQLVPQHISQRRASVPPMPREKIWCEGTEYI